MMLRRAFVVSGAAWGAVAAAAPSPARRLLHLAASPFGHDIDPYRDAESGVDELAWLYADGLVGWDGGLTPLLAQRLPERSQDGMTYRYRLRAAKWHDGRPLRARDVVAAFDAVRPTPWGFREPYARVREVRATGDLDLVVNLRAPLRGFAGAFFGPLGFPALPVIRHDGGPLPLGTGPFAVRAKHDERWSLERWPFSPRGTGTLDGIELALLSSNVTANLQLLSGEADIALPLPPNIAGDRFTRVPRVTSTAVLLINVEGLLGSALVRRAFAAVADVPSLQHAYDRRSTGTFASLLLEGPDDRELAAALVFRPERARELDGLTRERELVLAYVGGSPAHERTMTLLQQNLSAAGLRSSLRPYPAAAYLGPNGPLRSGAFDVALDGLLYGDDPDLAADWSCANRPPRGGNFARWCDPAFEAALRRESPAPALRILYSALPCIPLARAYEYIGVAPRVGNFELVRAFAPATYLCARWTLNG